jgi:ribokinase
MWSWVMRRLCMGWAMIDVIVLKFLRRNATIFNQSGTNTLLRPSDIEAVPLEGCQLVYVADLTNRSADCFSVIVERAKSAGAFIAVNPGLRQITSRCERGSYRRFAVSIC